jgi:hypothetical protein
MEVGREESSAAGCAMAREAGIVVAPATMLVAVRNFRREIIRPSEWKGHYRRISVRVRMGQV